MLHGRRNDMPVRYPDTLMSKYEREVVDYAVAAYSFLLNHRQEYSLTELSDAIKKHYDVLECLQNREVVRVLDAVAKR